MFYRLAKLSDVAVIADIQYRTKETNSNGIFYLLGRPFLRQYFKLAMSDPCTVFRCAEADDGRVIGFGWSVLDIERHQRYMLKHRWRLVFPALISIIARPSLFKKLLIRYKSFRKNDQTFMNAHGAVGRFWGWDPRYKDSESAAEFQNVGLRLIHALKVDALHMEVDLSNKRVYKYHKLNGATVDKIVTLPDGRERAFMTYDLTKPLRF